MNLIRPILLALLLAAPAAAQEAEPQARFGSLRASEVNLRTGPGMRYPIDWRFQRRNLPVQVLRELDTWRQIRAADGTEGWVHQSMLSGRRTVLVVAADAPVRSDPRPDSRVRATAERGAIGFLQSCTADAAWCAVEFGGVQGWIARGDFWGVVAQGEEVPVTEPLPEGKAEPGAPQPEAG